MDYGRKRARRFVVAARRMEEDDLPKLGAIDFS
jgi:hypothetical protein